MNLRSQRLRHVASDQLSRVNIDDVIWVVSVIQGRLHTLGRIRVLCPFITRKQARAKLGYEPYESKRHLVIPEDNAEVHRLTDISGLAKQIRFDSPSNRDRLTVKGRKVNGQQLQTMRKLQPKTVRRLEDFLRKQREKEEKDFKKESAKLAKLKAEDKKLITLKRTEQRLLRKLLFGDSVEDLCCICRKKFPIEFLIAAHVKPRSDCTPSQRNDWRGNVKPMCVFGCDALFERGLITVRKGRIHTNLPPPSTAIVRKYLQAIKGQKCASWSKQSSKYFNWHAQKAKDFWD